MSKSCAIAGCTRPFSGRGFCQNHLRRLKLYGDPVAGVYPGAGLAFIENAVAHESDECLIWPLSLTNGYGRIHLNRKTHFAHRMVCERAHGPAPSKVHQAAHNCGVPSCVNKRHLRWATPKENQADRVIHGTRRGGRGPIAKSVADAIRASAGKKTQLDLAKRYGVSVNTVRRAQRTFVASLKEETGSSQGSSVSRDHAFPGYRPSPNPRQGGAGG